MNFFKKLMLVILISNIIIFAEDDLNFPNDNGFTKHAASSAYPSRSFPLIFGYTSFTYGKSIIEMFYSMSVVVSENFYARVMSFSFGVSAAKMKRNEAVLSLSDLDAERKDNVLIFTLSGEPCRESTLSPCCFIGSPLSSPFSSPLSQGGRKRAQSSGTLSYLATADIVH